MIFIDFKYNRFPSSNKKRYVAKTLFTSNNENDIVLIRNKKDVQGKFSLHQIKKKWYCFVSKEKTVKKSFFGSKLQFQPYMTPRSIFKNFFKKWKSSTDITFSRFMQFEAALVLEKPLFELESSNFVSLSFAAIIKPFKLELQWVHI